LGVSANTKVKTWKKRGVGPYGNGVVRPKPPKKSQEHTKWQLKDPRPTRPRSAPKHAQ